jgi:hypothetical protein
MPRSFWLTDLVSREQEVVTLLDSWPWEWGGCIIGGYAVAAYGPPRYSRDVDVVIPRSESRRYVAWLGEMGFQEPRPGGRSHITFPDVVRFVRGTVMIDLMVGRVRDRAVGAEISETWITQGANRTVLELVRTRTTARVAVARPSAIWALKLLSARDQDLGDLYAMSSTRFPEGEVSAVLASIINSKVRDRLLQLPARLDDPKIFVDSLSRVEGGSPKDRRNLESWRSYKQLIGRLVLASTSEPKPT